MPIADQTAYSSTID